VRQQLQDKFLAQSYWQAPLNNLITIEQALLGPTALDYDSVDSLADANKVLIEVPNGVLAMELRFFGDNGAAENTEDIVQLYACAGRDNYRHFAQLTIIIGTADYGTLYHFHDGIKEVNEQWLTKPAVSNPANNTFGSYAFNTHAYDKFLVIASGKNCTTIGVEWRQL